MLQSVMQINSVGSFLGTVIIISYQIRKHSGKTENTYLNIPSNSNLILLTINSCSKISACTCQKQWHTKTSNSNTNSLILSAYVSTLNYLQTVGTPLRAFWIQNWQTKKSLASLKVLFINAVIISIYKLA